jgi:hypothetical protein
MAWLTCWLTVTGWLICLPANTERSAERAAHSPQTWLNLYDRNVGMPQILKTERRE